SPGPGAGSGRRTASRTSGPPGPDGSIAIISPGRSATNRLYGWGGVFIDSGAASVNFAGMDLDELFLDKPDDPLKLLTRQDLDPLSVEELHARIAILEAEIARVRTKLENA